MTAKFKTPSSALAATLIMASLIPAGLLATPALAAQRIYSYVPADAATKAKIDTGLTFVFDRGLMSIRIKEVLATEAKAEAQLDPVDDKDLGAKLADLLPAGAPERDLYAVKNQNQGPAMIRSFCPGATKGWLVFSTLRPRVGATVHALGIDPATGKAHYCTTMKFDYRGEWRLPVRMPDARLPASKPDWPF
jgi:hypothetical protein